VAIVEKGAAIGSHIVSGAVIEPRALEELFPDWRERGAPLGPAVERDELHWLSADGSRRVPGALVPRGLRNHGNHVASLGALCVWLGAEAEALGCDVLPGTPAVDVLLEDGRVAGVITGDLGVGR